MLVVRSLLVSLLLPVLLAAQAAPAPPTMGEIEQAFTAGQYQDVLRKIAIVLSYKGPGAENYDKATLWALKGESHLQLKQMPAAADAFASAAKEGKDENLVIASKATALLAKRSPGGRYVPKQPSSGASAGARPEPIDIIPVESRKAALAALFNDELKTTQSKIESLKKQTSLVPVMEGIKQVGELRALEIAGTGQDETSKQLLAGLSSHANTLMGNALKSMSEGVETISKAANEAHVVDGADGTAGAVVHKRGLTSVEARNLREVISTCQNIALAADELAKALGSDGSAFAGAQQQAQALVTRAKEVLDADYSPQVTEGPVVRPGQQQRQQPRPQQRQQQRQPQGGNDR